MSHKPGVIIVAVIAFVASIRPASPQVPAEKSARFTDAAFVVVDVSHLMKHFEPLRKSSFALLREESEARDKLRTELWKLVEQRDRLSGFSRGTDEYRKQEAELWQNALALNREQMLIVRQLRQRQAEAYASAHSKIQDEIELFRQDHRVGLILNSGLAFKIPELELGKKAFIEFSEDRGSLWWILPGAAVDTWTRYEVPVPPARDKPDMLGQLKANFAESMTPDQFRPNPEDVQERVNRLVVALSPEQDITPLIQERLAIKNNEPNPAKPEARPIEGGNESRSEDDAL